MQQPDGRSWRYVVAIYMLAGAVSGVMAGVALGAAGHAIDAEARVVIALVVACVATAGGLIEIAGGKVPLLQCNRETPRRWVARGPAYWAVRNGLSLGCGATTRIGFAIWYLVPAAAFLSASPLVGAMLFGVYGATRTGLVGVLIGVGVRRGSVAEVSDFIVARFWLARRASAAVQAAVGATGIAVIAL